VAEETKKKREFGAALQQVRNAQARLRDIEREIADNDLIAEEFGSGATSAEKLMQVKRYAEALEKRKGAQKTVIARTEEALERKRGELVEATRRRKTIERLRERAVEEHARAVRKEEQTVVDELTIQKYQPPE
jgi:flagellar export protein FliJ